MLLCQLAGCGGQSVMEMATTSDEAKSTLIQALDAWKNGTSQKVSETLEIPLLKSPLRCSLRAAVLDVPSVMSVNRILLLRKKGPLGAGIPMLGSPAAEGGRPHKMPEP